MVEARRLHIEASVFRCVMIAMSRVRNSVGEIEDAPMILYRARGGSLEADMVFIIIECIDADRIPNGWSLLSASDSSRRQLLTHPAC